MKELTNYHEAVELRDRVRHAIQNNPLVHRLACQIRDATDGDQVVNATAMMSLVAGEIGSLADGLGSEPSPQASDSPFWFYFPSQATDAF